MEKLDYLIDYLLQEDKREAKHFFGDMEDRKKLYRALVNIREPKEISSDFLKVEDEYLQEELSKAKVTKVGKIKTIQEQYEKNQLNNSDKISLWQGDITKLKIGSIVNAGNSQGLGCFLPNHNCIDNQINTLAGVRLRLACNEEMKKRNYHLATGEVMITKGYNLPAENVIQTVGPIVDLEVTEEKEKQLAKCYQNAIELAIQNGIRTIAFPCISTGVFHFPKELASKIAITTVDEIISKHRDAIDKVVFNLWSDEDVMIYEQNIKNN